jgi:isovaleryl-CoA dehydrogenase
MSEPAWRDLDLLAPTPEHALLAETLREFVTREVEPQAAAHDRSEAFNHALFLRAGELGLLGITLPAEHGGAGLDAIAAVQLMEALSTSDPGFALSVLAHSVLFAQNVAVNGSEDQKARIVPRAASGEWVGGLCMTEPDVGTDVLAMRTRAKRDGDVYVLDGRKTFITNGGIDENTLGDVFVVYAATGERAITSFLVEKGMAGFSLGQKWKDKLGMRASFTAELVFDGVRVPLANRLGDEGQGALQMMRNLEIERLTLAAMSATSPRASPNGARCAPSSTTLPDASISSARASASTPTRPSSSPPRWASAWPTRRSRCSAATGTWGRT